MKSQQNMGIETHTGGSGQKEFPNKTFCLQVASTKTYQ
jgi:hypothetical protein